LNEDGAGQSLKGAVGLRILSGCGCRGEQHEITCKRSFCDPYRRNQPFSLEWSISTEMS
jgi:hypothetical protein